MIGTKHREYAREILQCATTKAKLAWLGDSLMSYGGYGFGGLLPRLLNVEALDGWENSAASAQYLHNLGKVTSTSFVSDSTAIRSPGEASGFYTDSLQTYFPHGALEVTFEASPNDIVNDPADYNDNRIALDSFTNETTPGRAYIMRPTLAASTRFGDIWKTRIDAHESLTWKVCFLAGPQNPVGERFFLQVCDSAGAHDMAHSEDFALYQAEYEIVQKTLVLPWSQDVSDHWGAGTGAGFRFNVSVRPGDAGLLENKWVSILTSEVCATGNTGYSHAILSGGGGKIGDRVNPILYDDDAHGKYFAASGITHCVIALIANSPAETIVAKHQEFVEKVLAEAPNMKFIILAPYELDPAITDKADVVYDWAEANGHLWLSLEPFMPSYATMYQGINDPAAGVGKWENSYYYYGGENVLDPGSSKVYVTPATHTSMAASGTPTEDFATELGAAKWVEITTFDANDILEMRAYRRNFLIADDTHPTRTRGYPLMVMGVISLLNTAAAMPLAQNVRAGLAFGPENEQKGTMPQPMVSV